MSWAGVWGRKEERQERRTGFEPGLKTWPWASPFPSLASVSPCGPWGWRKMVTDVDGSKSLLRSDSSHTDRS